MTDMAFNRHVTKELSWSTANCLMRMSQLNAVDMNHKMIDKEYQHLLSFTSQ